jgi:hypothetical protein
MLPPIVPVTAFPGGPGFARGVVIVPMIVGLDVIVPVTVGPDVIVLFVRHRAPRSNR